MRAQEAKASAFRVLHTRAGAFIMPNPWDVGSARLLAALGFEALATTSAGHAFSVGRRDNTIGRDETMAHVSALAAAVELPVSADLGRGFGDDPEAVAETIRLAAGAGAVGGSIEDGTGRAGDPVYALELAAERVRAAVETARPSAPCFAPRARYTRRARSRSRTRP
jgi:2-methylisocitrate lyase-like PEP mutase family enzyme